jgi:predicted dehydrogenase
MPENSSATILEPLRIGVTGLGGYGGTIVRALSDAGGSIKLTALCDPDLESHAEAVANLRASGVAVFGDYSAMLAGPVEAVWLPVPIHLHRPFTEQALRAGKAVMCEKPAAGCLQDVDAMISARDHYGIPVLVGFQDIYAPHTQEAGRLLAGGAIGRIRQVKLLGAWPRDPAYYQRREWAGKLRNGETWILDSPAQNALAHFLNLALHWTGCSPNGCAGPVGIEAELYRANPIENYDTCGLRVHFENDATLLALLTHACHETIQPEIHIVGEHGEMHFRAWKSITFQTPEGPIEVPVAAQSHQSMIEAFASVVRGKNSIGLPATLEMARNHTLVVNGASATTPVHTVPPQYVTSDGINPAAIEGITDLMRSCVATGRLPHETGAAEWTRPAGSCDLRDFREFHGPAEESLQLSA